MLIISVNFSVDFELRHVTAGTYTVAYTCVSDGSEAVFEDASPKR